VNTSLAALVSLVAGLGVDEKFSNETGRRAIWLALVGCVAFGPSGSCAAAATHRVANKAQARIEAPDLGELNRLAARQHHVDFAAFRAIHHTLPAEA